ncbi:glycosyltransferase family 4 protein [Flavobacterium sp.]|jgi:glycogen(starch) synthase|uniref:glycosyltransferase family 4 protein n=1 Tax=Flavobacterium sp. TaxID=239 RepID=UPI0037BE7FDD
MRQFKVGYAAGPGDVAGTFRYWRNGQRDPSEVAETYSGQFFDQIKATNCNALVIASHPRPECIEDERLTIQHLPKATAGKGGLSYHLAEIRYWMGVMWKFKRSGCRVAIVSGMEHWWLLTLLCLSGVKIVPTIHCTFWPKGFRPGGFKDRVIQALNGWFWRNIPTATISISPECERQIMSIAGPRVKGVLHQARPHYKAEYFLRMRSPNWSLSPFQIMYAGRVEIDKGVFELVELMDRLTSQTDIDARLEICGDGCAISELREQVKLRGLDYVITIRGKLGQVEMHEVIQRSHVVIVPTSGSFKEGLNKVVIEGVLSSRPVVATSVCPANELFPKSVVEVDPGDVSGMLNVIVKLATDEIYYEQVRSHCPDEGRVLFDEENSWGSALASVIRHVYR